MMHTEAAQSTKTKDEEKLSEMIEFLTESHLDTEGGYPFAYRWVRNVLVYASVDENTETDIHAYSRKDLLAWHRRAMRWLKRHPDEYLGTALHEVPWPENFPG